MKKKIISIVLALLLGLSLLAFAACGSDSDLLRRIEQLEQELAEMGTLVGPQGPTGPQGPAGNDGAQGQQGNQGIQGPPGESGVPQERIYTLGQTFTYISSQGLRLFSIRVRPLPENPTEWIQVTVTNINAPSFVISDVVRVRIGNTTFRTSNISSTTIRIDEYAGSNFSFGGLGTGNNYMWFGSPTVGDSINAFAVFRVRP